MNGILLKFRGVEMEKIGVVLITYQRFDRFKQCFESLLRNRRDVEEIVIVDDCSIKDRDKYDEYFNNIIFSDIHVFKNKTNSGVGVSKNKGLKYFYEKGYDYIFTIEDDVNIISPDIFIKYINLSKATGYQYVNFGLHGPMNVGKATIMKLCGVEVALYPNIIGAFSLHTKKLIDEIGFYDEKFYNAWEHVDYCYQASLKDLTSPFWLFVDLVNSDSLIIEQVDAINDSSIRPRSDWTTNISNGAIYFAKKHGVEIGAIPRP